MDGKSAAMGRQLDAAQAITHIGSWEWDLASGTVTWSDELYRIYGLEPRSKGITLDVFLSAVHPDDRDRIHGEVQAAIARGKATQDDHDRRATQDRLLRLQRHQVELTEQARQRDEERKRRERRRPVVIPAGCLSAAICK
jgi:PAS domain-containing protein